MRRTWSTLIVSLLATIGLLAGTPAPAQAVKKPSPIKVAPSVPVRGAKFTVSGTMPTKVIRPVQLERKAGTKWVKMTTGKTSKAGRYKLTTTITKATKLTLRVVAKKVKIKGKWYPKLTTKAKVIKTKAARAATITANLPLTAVGLHYTAAPTATGGNTPYAWSATGLPAGLIINSRTGSISGTSTKPGNYTTRITVRTQAGLNTTKTVTIKVGDASRRFSMGSAEHTCAVTASGAAKCWGTNGSGQLGDGTTTDRHTPTQISGLTSGVVAITAAPSHSCALLNTGMVKCWGANNAGQLGDDTTTDRHTPTQVSGLTGGVVAITAAQSYSCALLNTGGVKCWGANDSGQLGDGTTTDRHTPTQVSGLISGVTALSSGSSSSCVLTSAGAAKCWGDNTVGQLGDGTTTGRHTPTQVSGLAGAVTISTGPAHTCAVTNLGAKCWGYNHDGQLGDGTITDRSTPTRVWVLTSNTVGISAGAYHTCAVDTAGAATCWGKNAQGQLGDGTNNWTRSPTAVTGLSGVTAISAGAHHTCALTNAGTLWCWGHNLNGQLGDGTTTERRSPVKVLALG